MLKDIKYQGINLASSDYDAAAGSLAVAHNVIDEHGYLEQITLPSEIATPTLTNMELLHIHVMTTGVKCYIVYNTSQSKFQYYSSASAQWVDLGGSFIYANLKQVTSVGNTLCMLMTDGMYYHLYNGGTNTYASLGKTIPNINLEFTLKHSYTMSNTDVSGGFNNAIHAEINTKVAKANEQGKFAWPFFVRYAVRLFDGSFVNHSAPILMVLGSECVPYVLVGKSGSSDAYAHVHQMVGELLYKTVTYPASLSSWGDIVKGVELYVSSPIRGFSEDDVFSSQNQTAPDWSAGSHEGGAIMGIYNAITGTSQCTYRTDYIDSSYKGVTRDIPDYYKIHFGSRTTPRTPEIKLEDYKNFYFVKELSLEDCNKNAWTQAGLGDLRNLEVQRTIQDGYEVGTEIHPDKAYIYNERIHLFGITKERKAIHPIASMLQAVTSGTTGKTISYYIKLKEDKEVWIDGVDTIAEDGRIANVYYIFVPYVNATEMKIVCDGQGMTLALKPHSFLNGAYWSSEMASPATPSAISAPASHQSSYAFKAQNKLYTSEVGNPYYFPLGGINTIGAGEIRSVAAAVKTIDLGQFGNYPFYAFTDSGIWAMEVSKEGLLAAKQPMSTEIIKQGAQAVPVSDSVVFVSARGLMMVGGNKVTCISDALEGITPSINASVKDLETWINNLTMTDVRQYFQSADLQVIYDTAHDRLHVFRPAGNNGPTYHYVMSRTGKWYTMTNAWNKAFGNNIVQATNSHLFDLTGNESISTQQTYDFILVTRPISFDTDALKKLRDNIQRGSFVQDTTNGYAVKCVLEGSYDLESWAVIGSSANHKLLAHSGTPYKYFRWTVLGKLKNKTGLSGLTADVIEVRNNRLR